MDTVQERQESRATLSCLPFTPKANGNTQNLRSDKEGTFFFIEILIK